MSGAWAVRRTPLWDASQEDKTQPHTLAWLHASLPGHCGLSDGDGDDACKPADGPWCGPEHHTWRCGPFSWMKSPDEEPLRWPTFRSPPLV